MRLALLAVMPALAVGFTAAGRTAALRTATTLAARRSLFPMLRRSELFFPDMDDMFEQMEEMKSEMATRFPRSPGFDRMFDDADGPSLSLLGKDIPEELKLKKPLGFDVDQDDRHYKVAVHVPDVDAKDVELGLDHDGRVLRLKGERTHEEEGMKMQSKFEKAILLPPDVDTSQIAANMDGDTLTVFAPKIETKLALDAAKDKKIEIEIEVKPPTKLAVESLKDEAVEAKKDAVEGERGWPVKDFGPY